ncbi:MAG: N-acetylmuramoyl-L-alanine amidase [Nocardioidaceae bacterium]
MRSAAASALSVEAVEPRIEDVAVPALTAARRADLTPGLERVEESDTPLVAHVMRTGLPQFSMAGVTWDQGERVGDVTAQIRVFEDTGWSEWTLLPAPDDEGPSITEEPDARAGTFPAWVGNATGIEVAVFTGNGTVPRNVEVSAIDPGTSPYDGLMLSAPSAAQEQAEAQKSGPLAGTFPGLPRVITREEWGADESLGDKCWSPRLGTTFKAIFVHHTAGSNDYSEYESPALVRGIYAYHVVSRGWCDIGYNFLVDRYGNVFEGRSGGIRLPVRGAHSGDYNLNSTGISAMGNFDRIRPLATAEARAGGLDLLASRNGIPRCVRAYLRRRRQVRAHLWAPRRHVHLLSWPLHLRLAADTARPGQDPARRLCLADRGTLAPRWW